jgi:hypothetical protein
MMGVPAPVASLCMSTETAEWATPFVSVLTHY